MAKIFIGIPEHKPWQEFNDSLSQFLPIVKQSHDIEVYRVRGKSLVDAQNDIAEVFLASDKDYLLLLEEDHWGHTPAMLESLLKADTYMCAINYYSRHRGKLSCLLQYTGNPDYRKKYKELHYTDGIHDCDLAPFGMTLIKRETFDIINKPYFNINGYSDYIDGVVATDQAFCDELISNGIYPKGCFDYVLTHRGITKDNYIELRKMDIMKSFEEAENKVIKYYTDLILEKRKLKDTPTLKETLV